MTDFPELAKKRCSVREYPEKLGQTYLRPWFLQAPVVLVICGDHQAGWKRADGKDHKDIDVSILVDHLTLAAADAGLGTCWICNFDAELSRRLLALPEHIEPIAYLPLGFPATAAEANPRHLKRKEMKDIIHYENF